MKAPAPVLLPLLHTMPGLGVAGVPGRMTLPGGVAATGVAAAAPSTRGTSPGVVAAAGAVTAAVAVVLVGVTLVEVVHAGSVGRCCCR